MNNVFFRILVAAVATLILGTLMGCETTGGRHVIVPTNPGERVATPYIGVSPNQFRAESRPVYHLDGRVSYETVMVPITVRDEIELRRQAERERDDAHRRSIERRRQAEWEADRRAREIEKARQDEIRRRETISREIQSSAREASRRMDELQRRNQQRLQALEAARDRRSR